MYIEYLLMAHWRHSGGLSEWPLPTPLRKFGLEFVMTELTHGLPSPNLVGRSENDGKLTLMADKNPS